ncbi:hypothetical protein B0H10DRAFT_1724239, partial [Mycena sp. CBHHK59/15]
MTKCTPTKCACILRMHDKENMDFEEIGAELDLPCQTVSQNYHQVVASGDPYHYACNSGCPRRFTERDMCHAVKAIQTGEARDGSDVQRMLFLDVPDRTVHQALQKEGLNGHICRAKPLLSKIH